MAESKIYALELDHVSKYFNGIHAADDINIKVEEHQIYGIIGPNGAGKTTLFNLITGIYTPTSGEIRLFGEKISGLETHIIARKGIARTFQNIRLFGDLTVYQNVLTACQSMLTYSFFEGIFKTRKYREQEGEARKFCEDMLRRVGLFEYRDMQASKLPYGQQRRLEIIRALATGARILLLDEPAAGMNEDESAELSSTIRSLRDDFGVTVVLIDHHMDVIMDVCERISVVNFGSLLAEGTAEEIQNNPQVIEAYLGSEDENA